MCPDTSIFLWDHTWNPPIFRTIGTGNTMQKIGSQTTKTNETPAKNWDMPFDVVVMKRKILFVKLPPHPSVLYRSAACPFFLMGQRQRCKNFQLFTLRREAEYIKDQLCTNIFHRGQGAKIIWWSITHQPDLASLLPSKSTMCGTFPKIISWTKRVHFRPKL